MMGWWEATEWGGVSEITRNFHFLERPARCGNAGSMHVADLLVRFRVQPTQPHEEILTHRLIPQKRMLENYLCFKLLYFYNEIDV
jgi:hypothetical protein